MKKKTIDVAHMPVCLFFSSVLLIPSVNFRVRDVRRRRDQWVCFRSSLMKPARPGRKIWVGGEVPAIETE